MTVPTLSELETTLRTAFTGSGAAIRREDEAPVPGEPFMSIADAVTLGAAAIHELLFTRDRP